MYYQSEHDVFVLPGEVVAERFRNRARTLLNAEILSAAEDHLAARGCVTFSLEAVAAQVGVAKGTVYLHFSNRLELIRRALDGASERCSTLMAEMLGTREVTEALGEYAKTNLQLVRGLTAATGQRRLVYPCCLHQLHCPYAESDALVILIATALERSRARRQLAGDWWDAATLARWIRVLLGDTLVRGLAGDATDIDDEIDMAMRLLAEALGATGHATT